MENSDLRLSSQNLGFTLGWYTPFSNFICPFILLTCQRYPLHFQISKSSLTHDVIGCKHVARQFCYLLYSIKRIIFYIYCDSLNTQPYIHLVKHRWLITQHMNIFYCLYVLKTRLWIQEKMKFKISALLFLNWLHIWGQDKCNKYPEKFFKMQISISNQATQIIDRRIICSFLVPDLLLYLQLVIFHIKLRY